MQPNTSSRWFPALVPVRAIRERLREMLTLRSQSVFPLTLVAALSIVFALPAYTQTTLSPSPQSPASVATMNAPPADADLHPEAQQLKQHVPEQHNHTTPLHTNTQTPP